jgi:exopolyphosphatase/guanosine-5'-triphosphate,3'-diphosphate pyrophosphatase
MIIGRALEAQVMESYRVGSVAWSMKHFPQGQFTASAFRSAEVAAKAVLDDALSSYAADQWDVAYGASGTIGAVGDVLAASGAEAGVVTREGLDWLLDRLLKAGCIEKLRMDGMRDDRKAVIGGGLSVLRAVFDLLDIREMKIAQGALRHGVQYELMERDESVADLRTSTVARLATRFAADAAQARRVGETASALYVQLDPAARGGGTTSRAGRALRKLGWAAQLHEIGALVSHSDYHKHGAYILDNADAPGFATNELHQLSQLVLGHRGKLRKLESSLDDETFVAQLVALRLAVILCHARRDPDPNALRLTKIDARTYSLVCRPGWSDAYPQSAHLLREEALAWQKTGWRMNLGGC